MDAGTQTHWELMEGLGLYLSGNLDYSEMFTVSLTDLEWLKITQLQEPPMVSCSYLASLLSSDKFSF